MIKAIIFDCFGVLTATELWKEFIATLPEDVRREASDLNRVRDASLISLKEFNDQIKQLTGRLPSVIESRTKDAVEKNEPLFNYIKELHKSYKTAILSNVGSNWVREVFLNDQEQKLFDEIILSYEVFVTKPDPDIYLLTAEKLGVEPEECIFIDDGEHNCLGAQKAGMKAVHYNNFVQCKMDIEQILITDSNN